VPPISALPRDFLSKLRNVKQSIHPCLASIGLHRPQAAGRLKTAIWSRASTASLNLGLKRLSIQGLFLIFLAKSKGQWQRHGWGALGSNQRVWGLPSIRVIGWREVCFGECKRGGATIYRCELGSWGLVGGDGKFGANRGLPPLLSEAEKAKFWFVISRHLGNSVFCVCRFWVRFLLVLLFRISITRVLWYFDHTLQSLRCQVRLRGVRVREKPHAHHTFHTSKQSQLPTYLKQLIPE
jgi:hypothetical protein